MKVRRPGMVALLVMNIIVRLVMRPNLGAHLTHQSLKYRTLAEVHDVSWVLGGGKVVNPLSLCLSRKISTIRGLDNGTKYKGLPKMNQHSLRD